MIAQFDDRVLDGRFYIYIDLHLRINAIFIVFENRISKAVTGGIREFPPGRQGRRAPVNTALFIPDIESLSGRIADRIIIPGSEAEFVSILMPGISLPAFRNDGAEIWIGEYIDPGRGSRPLPGCGDDIFAAVGRATTEPSVKTQ